MNGWIKKGFSRTNPLRHTLTIITKVENVPIIMTILPMRLKMPPKVWLDPRSALVDVALHPSAFEILGTFWAVLSVGSKPIIQSGKNGNRFCLSVGYFF
jgi:hypothetical protein